MGGQSPATSTVPGAAGGDSDKLSFGRLGLRRVVMCRVDSTLLAWLQGQSGAETPGAIGEVLARAVADGIPSLQTKGLPPNSPSASASGDADGGRLVAFTVDRGLVQQLAEIAGDEAPAVVGTTAIAAAMEAASLSGGIKRASTRKRRTTSTRRRAKASTATTTPAKAKAADTAGATAAVGQSGAAQERHCQAEPPHRHIAPLGASEATPATTIGAGRGGSAGGWRALVSSAPHPTPIVGPLAGSSGAVARRLAGPCRRCRARAASRPADPPSFDRWPAPRARRMRRGRAEESRVSLGRCHRPSFCRPVRHSRARGNPCPRLFSPPPLAGLAGDGHEIVVHPQVVGKLGVEGGGEEVLLPRRHNTPVR